MKQQNRMKEPVMNASRHCVCRVAVVVLAAASGFLSPASAEAQALSNTIFDIQIGSNGEISKLAQTGDKFKTNYVLSSTNLGGKIVPKNTSDHWYLGELLFSYKLETGAWKKAMTNQSGDVRKIAGTGAITVTYENSSSAQGIQNFKLVETYSLVDDYFCWQIAITNTSTGSIEFGDIGLPISFNNLFSTNDILYEARVLYHEFTGQNSSYLWVGRPSGVGNFFLMVPDSTTGAAPEYKDNWHGTGTSGWGSSDGFVPGLDVWYLHSNAIKSTSEGYLPNTSLTLVAGESKTYAFKFYNVASQAELKDRLYKDGLIDITVVPSLILPTDQTGKIDLHTSKTIASVTGLGATITSLGTTGTDHQIYEIKLAAAQLGQINVVVTYGSGETTTLQFYGIEPVAAALQRHATFMVNSTVSNTPSDALYHVFDDWMMDSKSRRGSTAGWGWGDDWGWTHGEFLAEKNSLTPVAAEVTALDNYLDAIWTNNTIDHSAYTVQDWWCTPDTSASNTKDCYYDRAYAYPHAFNTYFAMYKIASKYPNLVKYHQTADAYLMTAYKIIHTLYNGHGDPGTGYMGISSLPEIIQALTAAGHTTEANSVSSVVTGGLYPAFSGQAYPFGSEYNYDNTGEEGVYMAANMKNDATVMSKCNAKTRACRGQEPVWYFYADPITINGEAWWNFQYTAALAGTILDDWTRNHSTTPEVDERLSYAAKLANLGAINSGQIDSNAANIGTVAWTYQTQPGIGYQGNAENGKLHNNWRQMAGEADLGLWGAIRLLSSDVSNDPIFGTYCYGCDVAQSGSCSTVVPHDGVNKRLNFISQKLSFVLDRDQVSQANVGSGNDYIGLTLANQDTSATHTTTAAVIGLAAGSYSVTIDDGAATTVTAAANGKVTSIPLSITNTATHAIVIAASGVTCATVAMPDGGLTGMGGSGAGGNGTGKADGGAGGIGGGTGGTSGGGTSGTKVGSGGAGGSSNSGLGGSAKGGASGSSNSGFGGSAKGGAGGSTSGGAGGNGGASGNNGGERGSYGGKNGGKGGSSGAGGGKTPVGASGCSCSMGARANNSRAGSVFLFLAVLAGSMLSRSRRKKQRW
jgi:hypothetical protein